MNAAEKPNQYTRNLQQQSYDPQFEMVNMNVHYNMHESQGSYEDYLHSRPMDVPAAGYYKVSFGYFVVCGVEIEWSSYRAGL